MNIGLLQCDHVAERFQPIAGDYPEMFGAWLGKHFNLIPYDVCNGVWPASLQECDGYICTGSRWSVYEDVGWIHELKSFVQRAQETHTPFIGICFGHQMMAEALGGKVEKSDYGWGVGIQAVEITQLEAWMQPQQTTLKLHYMHQDQVTRLPENSVVLARSEHCPVAAFRVGATMLGIQAHPEFTNEYSAALLTDRIEHIGAERVEQARASLVHRTDEDVFVQWVAEFLAVATSVP
jgi:GMP synthase-like glutamine amidotransferase